MLALQEVEPGHQPLSSPVKDGLLANWAVFQRGQDTTWTPQSVPTTDKVPPLASQLPLLIYPEPEEYSVLDHSALWSECLPCFLVAPFPGMPQLNSASVPEA